MKIVAISLIICANLVTCASIEKCLVQIGSACIGCEDGFGVSVSGTSCLTCEKGCKKCDNDKCTICLPSGYYVKSRDISGILRCKECIRGCDVCQNDRECEKCSPFYTAYEDYEGKVMCSLNNSTTVMVVALITLPAVTLIIILIIIVYFSWDSMEKSKKDAAGLKEARELSDQGKKNNMKKGAKYKKVNSSTTDRV